MKNQHKAVWDLLIKQLSWRSQRQLLFALVVAVYLSMQIACDDGETLPTTSSTPEQPAVGILQDGSIATATALPTVAAPRVVPDGLEIIWEVYGILASEYINRNELVPEELAEAAVWGMLDSLEDRHLSYIGPETFQIEQSEFSGKFQGIGAHVEPTRDGKRIVIVSPIAGSPAEKAGLKSGDVVMAVDNADTEGWSVIEAVNKIRGPAGEPVVLTVQRIGESELIKISIVRGTIELPSVRSRLLPDDPYGVVHILMFTEETSNELVKAMDELLSKDVNGIVLDLRQNPGGLLTSVQDVASEFLADGLVTYEIDSSGKRDEWLVKSGGRYTSVPLVVIVDGFSASGSEVLAGALQDYQRAVIIGTKTFGKGSVNLMRGLSNKGGLYFTIGRWYTPNGRQISSAGIEPDVEIKLPVKATEDNQMIAAIKQLDFQTSVKEAR